MYSHNPNNLDTNCTFVTMSALLGRSYDEMIKTLGWMDAEPDSHMEISVEDVEKKLAAIKKYYNKNT